MAINRQKLIELRAKAGMTQEQVARAIGVHPISYTRWETGARTPRPVYIHKLAELFGVPVSSLLIEDDKETTKKQPSKNNNKRRFAVSKERGILELQRVLKDERWGKLKEIFDEVRAIIDTAEAIIALEKVPLPSFFIRVEKPPVAGLKREGFIRVEKPPVAGLKREGFIRVVGERNNKNRIKLRVFLPSGKEIPDEFSALEDVREFFEYKDVLLNIAHEIKKFYEKILPNEERNEKK